MPYSSDIEAMVNLYDSVARFYHFDYVIFFLFIGLNIMFPYRYLKWSWVHMIKIHILLDKVIYLEVVQLLICFHKQLLFCLFISVGVSISIKEKVGYPS